MIIKGMICRVLALILCGIAVLCSSGCTGVLDLITGEDHYYLEARGKGYCETFSGDVVLNFVFVTDSESGWTSDEIAQAKVDLDGYVISVRERASEYGVPLNLSYEFKEASISVAATQDDTERWRNKVAVALGYLSEDNAQLALEAIQDCDSAPIFYLLNKKGRSVANMGLSRTGGESVIYYVKDGNAGAFTHELLHVFGARDFYYPESVQTLADTYLSGSIMISSDAEDGVDDLTAYLVGWRDDISPNAQAFLDGTADLTEQDLEDARELNTLTGFGTKKIGENTYTGNMVYGVAEGQGRLSFPCGDEYLGAFVNGDFHGYGILTWANGDKFAGQWVEGDRNGYGILTWANGDVYEGDWVNDVRTGKGTLTWADGTRYEGDWVDGVRHGHGVLSWPGGSKYDGAWDNGVRTGKGTYYWANGDVYEGDFVDGKLHGYGTITYADGRSYSGQWNDGKFVR